MAPLPRGLVSGESGSIPSRTKTKFFLLRKLQRGPKKAVTKRKTELGGKRGQDA